MNQNFFNRPFDATAMKDMHKHFRFRHHHHDDSQGQRGFGSARTQHSHRFFENHGQAENKRFFRRGDIKFVLLKLLQDKPRHGYEIIKVLEEKFKGFYSPSPGSVYPTLQMLEDQELIEAQKEGRKKVYHLTEEGAAHLKLHHDEDPFLERMEAFKDSDMHEMHVLREAIRDISKKFILVGREAMKNDDKQAQLFALLEETKAKLAEIEANDTKK